MCCLIHATISTLNKQHLTARLTTSYCAPSWLELIMNVQNDLVHHLISTKLRCAPPKYTPVGGTPTSHRHWFPFCTMVHNAGQWCTTLVVVHNVAPSHWGSARCSSYKPRQTCKHSMNSACIGPLLGRVHAHCFFHNFLLALTQLLSNFCHLLPFHLFPCSFFIFCASCSLLILSLAPGFFSCSMLLFRIFLSSILLFYNFWCSSLQDYQLSAPCSFIYFMACSLLLCVNRACSLLWDYP